MAQYIVANVYEDLSGVSSLTFDNPYDELLISCHDEPNAIQNRYQLHRATRNAQQKAKLLDPNFSGVTIDPILLRLVDPTVEPNFQDPRHCLTLWARPTTGVKALIRKIQEKLREVATEMWFLPPDNLHITALEITHSKSEAEIQEFVDSLQPVLDKVTDYTYEHRSRLIKPMIGYDACALALSFVPAAGEALPPGRDKEDDRYTYHHLRRNLYRICKDAGVKVESRYVVPSSHCTIGRFIRSREFEKPDGSVDLAQIKRLIDRIEEINAWLQDEFWPKGDERIKEGGEWLVGEEKGLDCRRGTLWYGDGQMIRIGKGF